MVLHQKRERERENRPRLVWTIFSLRGCNQWFEEFLLMISRLPRDSLKFWKEPKPTVVKNWENHPNLVWTISNSMIVTRGLKSTSFWFLGFQGICLAFIAIVTSLPLSSCSNVSVCPSTLLPWLPSNIKNW